MGSFHSIFLDDLIGQIMALFILTVAAAESAIGLALLENKAPLLERTKQSFAFFKSLLGLFQKRSYVHFESFT